VADFTESDVERLLREDSRSQVFTTLQFKSNLVDGETMDVGPRGLDRI
jgi:hypothetical protein